MFDKFFEKRNKASGYPKNIHVWSQHIPDLQIHIRRFLYDQLNPNSEVFGTDVDLNLCPEISLTLHVQVYHLASTVYHAPSDLSGIGGMRRKYIRATPNWRRKGVSRNDCVFVEREPENEGFQALGVAQVQMFFAFHHDGILYPCALVRWFETYGDQPCPETGMWRVKPDFDQHRDWVCSVIHIDSILRAVHLLPVFGKDFIPKELRYHQTLHAFKLYYVNKYADHHSHEVAY